MSNKGDRVQKWGELLAELADDAKKFDREKQEKLLAEKQKYRDFYRTLELEAADFQPKKLKQKLSQSLKNNLSNSIIVFSFTCDLAGSMSLLLESDRCINSSQIRSLR